jgi:hypothetical protein
VADLRKARAHGDLALARKAARAAVQVRATGSDALALAGVAAAPLERKRGRGLWPKDGRPARKAELMPHLSAALSAATTLSGPAANKAAERLFQLGLELGRRVTVTEWARHDPLRSAVRDLEHGFLDGLDSAAELLELDLRPIG